MHCSEGALCCRFDGGSVAPCRLMDECMGGEVCKTPVWMIEVPDATLYEMRMELIGVVGADLVDSYKS